MNEKEKELISKLSEKVKKLEKIDQRYVLGIVEGMSIVTEHQENSSKEEAEDDRPEEAVDKEAG